MTAYALMRAFAESGAGYYRSRASSVYPLVARLTESGLVVGEAVTGRADKSYRLSPAGSAELKAWVSPPFAPEDFVCGLDLFRARAHSIDLLAPDEQEAFFHSVSDGLEELLEKLEELVRAYRAKGDEVYVVASMGAVFETRARLQWVRFARESLGAARE